MATFKVVISDPKSRKAYQKEVDHAASGLLGKKIGETLSAASLGLEGYTLEITGGSDSEGFPMRRDVEGTGRKRIILSHPPGFHPARKGQRKRKSIRGNTISSDILQINTKVVEHGKKRIADLLGVKKEKPAEKKEAPKEKEKPKESQKEEKKPEPKKEEKPAEKPQEKEEKPAEEPGQEKAEKKMGIKKLE